jgi:hypothetical protein
MRAVNFCVLRRGMRHGLTCSKGTCSLVESSRSFRCRLSPHPAAWAGNFCHAARSSALWILLRIITCVNCRFRSLADIALQASPSMAAVPFVLKPFSRLSLTFAWESHAVIARVQPPDKEKPPERSHLDWCASVDSATYSITKFVTHWPIAVSLSTTWNLLSSHFSRPLVSHRQKLSYMASRSTAEHFSSPPTWVLDGYHSRVSHRYQS